MALVLYVKNGCPYCDKVTSFIKQQGRKDVSLENISFDEEARTTLIKEGGKQQVPCLFIDGQPLYESDDIVKWLAENPEE